MWEKLFAETEKAFGPADVLVNNAGVYDFAPLEAITEEHFHRIFNINVLGLLLASQAAAKQFGERGGSIINIGSVVSTIQQPSTAVYTATKGCGRCDHRHARERTWAEENPGELN